MKGFCLLVLCLGLHVFSVAGGPGATLPPPTADDEEVDENGEPARGLKGQTNPLAALSKSHAKCLFEGNIGMKNECSKYSECLRKGQIPAPKFCPTGKFFDHKRRLCVPSAEAECKNVCPTEGLVFPDPQNPAGILKCFKGVISPEVCPAGQVFVAAKKACGVAAASPADDDDE